LKPYGLGRVAIPSQCRHPFRLVALQQVTLVEHQQAGLLDLLVEQIHHILAKRHRQVKQTASQQSSIHENGESRGGHAIQPTQP